MAEPVSNAAGFYVTGGTLRPDAPSYVERQADRDLFQALLEGDYCYVLNTRQMGKSSLMVRTAARLKAAGITVAVLDLTAIGQNLTAEQWYGGLLRRLGTQLDPSGDLEDALDDFWQEHSRLGPLQRWMTALETVLLPRLPALAERTRHLTSVREPSESGPMVGGRSDGAHPSGLVIFLDEIDAVRSLPFSTDEFFAGIRECYNRRTLDPRFERLAFCLLGVAAPADLIQETRLSPFNIGRRIRITDFTLDEARPLARGLKGGERLLARVLYWTNGQPYLTQRLCREATETGATTAAELDRLCARLFLSKQAQAGDDYLAFVRNRLLRSEADLASLLDLYLQVRSGKRVADDETNPLCSILRLAGVARERDGRLQVRNPICARVFDHEWVRRHMPDAEVRRQRAAYWRGLLRAGAISLVILGLVGSLAGVAVYQRRQLRRALYPAQMNAAVQALNIGQIERVRELLAAQVRPGEEELRGFEWRYLWNQSRDASLARFFPTPGLSPGTSLNWDTQLAAASTEEGNLHFWDLAIPEKPRHTGELFLGKEIEFGLLTRDGKLVVAVTKSSNVEFWDPVRRQKLTTALRLSADPAAVDRCYGAAESADARWLVTYSESGNIRFWDLNARREIGPGVRLPNCRPLGIGWSLDRPVTGAVAAGGKTLYLWDMRTQRRLLKQELPGGHEVVVANLSNPRPDGSRLLVIADEQGLLTFRTLGADWQTKDEEQILGRHVGPVSGVLFSPDGQQLATAGMDGAIRLWNVADRSVYATLRGHTGEIWRLGCSRDWKRLYTYGSDYTVGIWDVPPHAEPAESVSTEKSAGISNRLALAPDGSLLAVGWSDGSIRLRTPDGEDRGSLPGKRTGGVSALEFSPDGTRLASCGEDKTVRMWDVSSRKQLWSREVKGSPWVLCWRPDGRMLATGGYDRAITLWDPATGRPLPAPALRNLPGDVCGNAAFSPDGTRLTFGFSPDPGRDQVQLYDLRTGQLSHWRQPQSFPLYVAFSPDGKTLVSTDRNGWGGHVWDVASRREQVALKGIIGEVRFTPDGKTLCAANTIGAITFWNMLTHEPIATLPTNEGLFPNLEITRDGTLMVTGNRDGKIRIWRAPSLKEIDASGGLPAK